MAVPALTLEKALGLGGSVGLAAVGVLELREGLTTRTGHSTVSDWLDLASCHGAAISLVRQGRGQAELSSTHQGLTVQEENQSRLQVTLWN